MQGEEKGWEGIRCKTEKLRPRSASWLAAGGNGGEKDSSQEKRASVLQWTRVFLRQPHSGHGAGLGEKPAGGSLAAELPC